MNFQVKENTVFNVALNVKNVDLILDNCKKNNVAVVKQKTKLIDKSCGLRADNYINYAIIKSCIDGVLHTIIDKSNYNGIFLPNFKYLQSNQTDGATKSPVRRQIVTHFDHLTYATYKDTSNQIIKWYKNVFNMERFQLNMYVHKN